MASLERPILRAGMPVPGTRYRVVRWLGAGGMGVVYEVEKDPGIRGVLKMMSMKLAADAGFRARFFDEVRVIAQLEHPNIVKVFDYDMLPDGTPFYVMELLIGKTVGEVLRGKGRVPPTVAYEITRQLLEALQCAHTNVPAVVHRDVKPDNLFLHAPRYGEPVLKLLDFGVSAIIGGGLPGGEGTFSGSPAYAAPEQIACRPVTPASDLYAAGLVLYELLSGVGPFDHHDGVTALLAAQCSEVPAPIDRHVRGLPPAIVKLLEDVLAKDPLRRPRDAYAFAERLYDLQWATIANDARSETVTGGDTTVRTTGPLSQLMAEAPARDAAPPASARDADSPPPRSAQPDTLSSQAFDSRVGAPRSRRALALALVASVMLAGVATLVFGLAKPPLRTTASGVSASSVSPAPVVASAGRENLVPAAGSVELVPPIPPVETLRPSAVTTGATAIPVAPAAQRAGDVQPRTLAPTARKPAPPSAPASAKPSAPAVPNRPDFMPLDPP